MGKRIIIAIDGYSACGKSTTARRVAQELEYIYIDSGAMYRAVTLFLIREGIEPGDINAVKEALSRIRIEFKKDPDGNSITVLNGENVEREIRSMDVSSHVSEVSAIRQVREKVVAEQREFGRQRGIVMDGRDIGSVVFPDAELKVFMTADASIRAERRVNELKTKGVEISLDQVLENIKQRDHIDENRKESPLVMAPDARILDNSNLNFEEQARIVLGWAREIIN